MSKLLIFFYGVVVYLIGLGGLTFFILFVGGWDFMPRHIDSETPGPLNRALLVNFSLMALFGVQHSVMARRGFKTRWTRILPTAGERSTYVLLSGVIMCLFCLWWQPLEGVVWSVADPLAQGVLVAIQIFGWSWAVASSFAINHGELLGLQQVYFHLVGKEAPAPDFTARLMYKVVRHPLQLGLLIGLWSTPTMTTTHLMLSACMTVYIFIGLYFEEKDLVAMFGQDYQKYQRRVRMILPLPKGREPWRQAAKRIG